MAERPQVSVEPDPDISQSFSVMMAPELPIAVLDEDNVYFLGLKKSALDKEFILSASIIPQSGSVTGSGLQSRIVSFTRKGESLFMLEASEGHVVTDSLPSRLVMSEFPILLEMDGLLVMDFNAGMRQVFTQGNWFASDMGRVQHTEGARSQSSPVSLSFIEKAQIHSQEKSVLEIRQAAQLSDGRSSPSFEVRYFIEPYIQNTNYTPIENLGFENVGLFQTPPLLKKGTGEAYVRSTIKDMSQPIVFHISHNTPSEYLEAVKAGVLYWNSAFDQDIIEVKVAPKGRTAPDPEFNIVQWVEWDLAGFAYADALMDPRTGEIRRSQVFMTSAFAVGSRERAHRLLRIIDTESAQASEELFASNPNTGRLCFRNLSSSLKHKIAALINADAPDDVFLRVSQDYVSHVIAHEIGHVLGLRHNFAGSLGANVSIPAINNLFDDYIKNRPIETAELLPSSSVMEYNNFKESVLMGHQKRNSPVAYAHDKMAIQHVYLNKEIPENPPLFCTDSQASRFIDCERFSRGRNPIEEGYYETRDFLKNLPNAIVEYMIEAKVRLDEEKNLEARNISINPNDFTQYFNRMLGRKFALLNTNSSSLKQSRLDHNVLQAPASTIAQQRLAFLQGLVDELGGFENVFFGLLLDEDIGLLDAEWPIRKLARIEAILERLNEKGITHEKSQNIKFTSEEKDLILDIAAQLLPRLQNSLVSSYVDSINSASWDIEIRAQNRNFDSGIIAELEHKLSSVAIPVLLATHEDQVETVIIASDSGESVVVEYPSFVFSNETRDKAANILRSSLVNLRAWSKEARDWTREELLEFYAAILIPFEAQTTVVKEVVQEETSEPDEVEPSKEIETSETADSDVESKDDAKNTEAVELTEAPVLVVDDKPITLQRLSAIVEKQESRSLDLWWRDQTRIINKLH